jgi:anaerobic magnesium-protoporphyrin IX monomethyl ester cyclase
MLKVILFFPKYESDKARLLPMSVLSVAAPLVKRGYEVRIIDQRVEKNWKELLIDEAGKGPLVFGISALTGKQISNGIEASRIIKEVSDVPIVWGGVHPSLLPYQTLRNENIDFVVIGEGEETFLELVDSLKTKSSFGSIVGIGYKKEGKILINPSRNFIDMNNLADIPYDLINIEDYISKTSFASGKAARNIAFYASRGCPHRCGFCYNQEFNKRKWRGKSAERVFREMKELIERRGISAFEIEDDEFFVDLERAKRICETIIENKLEIEIFTSCRVNYIMNMNEDYLDLLYRAGFRTLAFGVESGSKRILDLMHKDITIEQVLETIKKLKKAGINSKYYFMAGFPTETIDDLYKTTNLIQEMKQLDPQIRIPAWRVFTPYPGTDLYDLAVKEGWQPPKTLEEWANYDFNTIKMPWIRGRKKRIIKNVAFLNNYLEMQNTKGKGVFFKLAKIFSRFVNYRWRNHLFSFVPEKYIINLFLKLKTS